MPFREALRKRGRALERLVLCGPADIDPALHPQARRAESKTDSIEAARRQEQARRSSTTTAGSEDESSGEGTVVASQAPHLDPPNSPRSPLRASVLFDQASRHPQTGEPYSFLDSEYARGPQRSPRLDFSARTRDSRLSQRSSVLSYTPSAKSQRRACPEKAQTQALRRNDQPAFRGHPKAVELRKRDKELPPVPRDGPYGGIDAMLGEPRRR